MLCPAATRQWGERQVVKRRWISAGCARPSKPADTGSLLQDEVLKLMVALINAKTDAMLLPSGSLNNCHKLFTDKMTDDVVAAKMVTKASALSGADPLDEKVQLRR
jgi:hypothetical protein